MTAAERARKAAAGCYRVSFLYGVCIDCITAALLAHEAEVRRDEREACARLFEGTSGFLNWLCLDHGGEEAEKIAAMIRDSGREKERE